MDRDGVIDFAQTDRITRSVKSVETLNGLNRVVTRTYHWATNNSAVSNLVAVSEISTDGLRSWNSRFGITNQMSTYYAGNGNRYVTNTAPDGSYSVSHFQHGHLLSTTRKDAAGNQLSATTFTYDAHGRKRSSTDARNGTTSYGYDNGDRVVSVTTPTPGTGQDRQTTYHVYDSGGRAIQTILPDGATAWNIYSKRGELLTNYGARTYPVAYGYDAQGRKTNMTTWTNFAARSGAAATTWKYNLRGFMTNKVYADGNGPRYTYTPGGRLNTRVWARGITTTYATNAAGEVARINYSDSTAPVTNTFDRLGRLITVNHGTNTATLSYNAAGALVSETVNGLAVTNAHDSLARRTAVGFSGDAATLVKYGYDSASRLSTVTNGAYNVGYSYVANSPLVSEIVYRQNSTNRMTTTKSYDYLNRLQSISSLPAASGASPLSFHYAYNEANQRTRRSDADGSSWIYQYDSLGQVTSGKKSWADDVPVAGQQFEYAFDDIGNRTSTKSGGDANGGSLRSAGYSANNLNQYTSRDVPGTVDIMGAANPSAAVTVNSSSTYRKGEYFHHPLGLANSSTNVWQGVTNKAVLIGTTNTLIGSTFLPKTAEVFTYDLDGNMTKDGRWSMVWDGENRLVQMIATNVVSGARKWLVFGYDWKGRRISKTVSNWTGSAWTVATRNKFVYDGWNLVAELNGTNNAVIRRFVWGTDISGSMRAAGGVGGLLAINDVANGFHFAGRDGNGNVAGLVTGTNGAVSAAYEYGPFGETIRATGAMAKANPVRFSSKYVDQEADLAYYGYRCYSPSSGGWLNRDPLHESGGLNLYGFVANDPLLRIDVLGLCGAVKKCGVDLLTFAPHGFLLTADGGVEMRFDIYAQFKNDAQHDPAACKYMQYVQVDWTITDLIRETVVQPPRFSESRMPINDGSLHVDANPWTTDNTKDPAGNPFIDRDSRLTHYESWDAPGLGGRFDPNLYNHLQMSIIGVVEDKNNGYESVAGTSIVINIEGTFNTWQTSYTWGAQTVEQRLAK